LALPNRRDLKVESINEHLFLLVNANSTSPAWLLGLASFVAEDLLYLIPVILTALWMWSTHREAAVKALFAALIGLGISQVIGLVYTHPRPLMVGLGHTFVAHAAESSFPSDHGTLFFSVGLALLVWRARLVGLAVLAIGVAVAWSRVYVGLHFPFDMAGALVVAGVSCAVVWSAWNKLGIPLMACGETLYRRIFVIPISKKWVRA
jgi:undecaprenyl-diphosphatase